ncbi:MAG: 50S ribosomal protein L6 [Thermomicrobiales bacterium]|nr:50S ribosomal protein L6 [Thermomicrobiales bacterium]
MSRIGVKPVPVPATVQLEIAAGNLVTVKGPKGELQQQLPDEIILDREDGQVVVKRPSEVRRHKALHGLTRTLLNNMVVGVTEGFKKDLEIAGVGYRAAKDGSALVLQVGYSHPVRLDPPDGITYLVEGNNKVSVQGIDKQLVGEEAARVRNVRKPEPYKGKGIRYANERIRRKAGKAGKAGK